MFSFLSVYTLTYEILLVSRLLDHIEIDFQKVSKQNHGNIENFVWLICSYLPYHCHESRIINFLHPCVENNFSFFHWLLFMHFYYLQIMSHANILLDTVISGLCAASDFDPVGFTSLADCARSERRWGLRIYKY